VVMLIFSIVMTLISVSFNRIVTSSGQLVKSVETDIGGLIGLELFRCDLELAGFGLFWSMPAAVTYNEAESEILVDGCSGGCPDAKASLFNDGLPQVPCMPPRAYVIGDNVGYNDSDYIVLKGTPLAMNQTSRSWAYLNYSTPEAVIKLSKSNIPGTELTPGKGQRVIVVKSGVSAAGAPRRELVTNGGTFSLAFNPPLENFEPKSKQDNYLVYGVADQDSAELNIPFNRSDYYISRKEISKICARGTGVLYKTTINQDSKVTKYPILDCVADMQVVFYLDTNGDGEPDYHPVLADAKFEAADLREQLKEIRVYVLSQQGKADAGYTFPVADPEKAIVVGDPLLDPALGQVWPQAKLAETFGAGWRHYRWKLYTIVVQPKNL
jgi:hypothetical protein